MKALSREYVNIPKLVSGMGAKSGSADEERCLLAGGIGGSPSYAGIPCPFAKSRDLRLGCATPESTYASFKSVQLQRGISAFLTVGSRPAPI